MHRNQFNFRLQYDPAQIPVLAAEYMKSNGDEDEEMEEAGRRIAEGDYTRSNLECIYAWKSKRRLDLLKFNSDAKIEQALKNALAAKSVEEAISSLVCLAGVGVKMASAILTAIKPGHYTVLDVRALEALGVKNGQNLSLYIAYLEACQRMARDHGVSLRDFDRANWQWSKRQSSVQKDCG